MRGLAPRQTSVGVLNRLRGKHHWHACTTCKVRVYGCHCQATETNGRCQACRGGRRPVWELAREPRDCCLVNCKQLLSADELERYQLAGPGPWFQCRTCARCFGGYPKEKDLIYVA